MFQARLIFGLLLLLGVTSQNQKDPDEGRPYEFSFRIEGEQHRQESKDVNGIIQGEFGFITGDGVYHVTVYATDENGSFKILSMRNVKISEPLDQGGKRIADAPQQGVQPAPARISAPTSPKPPPPSPLPLENPPSTSTTPRSVTYGFTRETTHRHGCSGCGIVSTPPTGPLKFQNPTFKNQDNGGGEQKPLPLAVGPVGLIPNSVSPSPQSSFESPSAPDGPIGVPNPLANDPQPPQTELLAPGVSDAPLSRPPEQTRNQIPGSPKSVISQVKVDDGVIKVPGNDPIPIKDKYPNMADGLPEGITEKDITDLLYKFNYTVGFHGHYEKGLKNGAKIGGYFVNGRDGISRVVTYVADENGYRPKFTLVNLGLESEDTPKPDSEKKFGLKNFEFIWYPVK